tara:strand:+ start:953 stop:1099 length:147 start_codon:yes stop_codon:yes gene_type:complete
MDWIESLKEPITKLDVFYGIGGYLVYKWGMIGFEVVKAIYKNVKYNKR